MVKLIKSKLIPSQQKNKPIQKQKNQSNIVQAEDITCSICLEIFISPVHITCQHIFCLQCIEHLIIVNPHHTCPLCRQPFQEYQFSSAHKVQSKINKYLRRRENHQAKLRYYSKVEEFNEAENERRVYCFKKGDNIDLYDHEMKEWTQVTITEFKRDTQSEPIIVAKQILLFQRKTYYFTPSTRCVAPWKKFSNQLKDRDQRSRTMPRLFIRFYDTFYPNQSNQ